MVTIKDLLQKKGNKVWSVTPKTTVLNTLKMMSSKDVGALMVLDGDRIAGIISERDIVRTMAETQECHLDSPISNIMTHDVVHVSPDQTLDSCVTLMIQRNFRHLPVVDHNRLVGFISMRDLIKELLSTRETITSSENYLEV